MIEPKFSIGQHVKSDEYDIKDAVVIGVKLYKEGNHNIFVIDRPVNECLDSINNCDYILMWGKDNNTFSDSFTECYLKEIK